MLSLNRVLQRFLGRSIVVLLLLLTILCSQCSEATSTFLYRYYSCKMACSADADECIKQCEENKTCAASRKFCKDMCFSAVRFCKKRYFDANVE